MEACRIIKTITSDRLPELNQFKGRSVEIIILPDIEDDKNKKTNLDLLKELQGSCPDLPDGMEFQRKIREEWDR
jgi:hypothetical protein